MKTGDLSKARLDRLHKNMASYVERSEVPGIVTLLSRHGEVHVDVVGSKSLGGPDPLRRDTIFRMVTRRDDIASVPGRFGWDGGLGTSWFCDPKEDLVGIALTQRFYPLDLYRDFWTLAYQAIDD